MSKVVHTLVILIILVEFQVAQIQFCHFIEVEKIV